MLRIFMRAAWAFIAANGAFMLWVARYGELWRYAADLGWFQLYVLRPGLYAVGAGSIVAGLWGAVLRYTTPGRVLRVWADDVRHDLHCGAVADLGWRVAWGGFVKELWSRRMCALGRHDNAAMEFRYAIDYGVPTGTYCDDCGLKVADTDVTRLLTLTEFAESVGWPVHRSPADLLRAQAGRCAEAGLHDTAAELREEAERMDRGKPDDRFTTVGPDPLRHLEPDDGCFTQGSDPVVRGCDKEG